ncbi:protein kinase [Nonomuraea sp. NPDC049141]|uniref:serine/threonine-protein kinase n=1 Tax=unclassified Nonomuraea TaxID=2593643 RepID=UPI0033C82C5E
MTKLGKVGPYTLLERLGRGGMGEVYLASSRRGERVALKVLHELAEDHSMRVRLEREVRALRRVESPYVAKVLDADLSCDRPYLVMEHIEGSTLLDRVRHSGPLNMAQLVELAQGIATALAIIHAAGVVHRDLKPANILMGAEGPVLIDFGIAQVHDATRLTMTGTFLGTPGYTAPEIFADEQVDSPADIHAWAATVSFAATGRPTFGRGTAEAQMYAVLNGQADLKGVPVALLSLVRAALNREPGKRPTAALLADRLSRLAKVTSPPEPDPARAVSPAEEGAAVRGRTGEEAKPRTRTAEDVKPRSRTGEEAKPRSRTGEEAKPRTRTAADDGKVPAPRTRSNADGKVPAPRGRTNTDGKVPAPRGRMATDGKSAVLRSRTGEGVKATPVRSRARAVTGKPRTAGTRDTGLRSESGATALPAGNAALLLLAVLAVPCVVASVIWPIATIGITAVFVLLTRTLWMSHWMVRKRVSRRVRVTLRVVLFPFAFAGATATAVAWPGVPVAMAAGGALWLIGGGQIDSDWWQQPAPVTAAGVVFGMLCGGITGREIERVGARLPDLRREGLRALAVLGGFVALCAAAVRAIALLL